MYLKKELYELIQSDESIFDFIQESALDGLWYWDLENPENEWMNARFWTVLGYNPDEMPHKSSAWQGIINQDDLKVANDNFTKHLENPNHPYDQVVRYAHKDGSTKWIRCRGLAIRDANGKPIRMLGAHQDITELKRSELELYKAKEKAEESEAKLSALFTSMSEMVVLHELVFDENGEPVNYRITDCNNAFTRITGITRKNAIGRLSTEVYGTEQPPFLKEYSEVVLTGKPNHYETYFQPMDKHFSISVISPEKNKFATVTTDITEIKQSKFFLQNNSEEIAAQNEELAAQNVELNQAYQEIIEAKEKAEESENKLKAAVESMSDAVFISDRDGNFLDFNDAFATFHRFKNKQECAKTFKEYPLFLDVYFPNGVLATIEQWVVPSALRGEMGMNKEFTLLRRDTNETWIGSYNYAPIRNNEGHIIGSVVTCRDVTDSKKAQFEFIAAKEKIEESEYRLLEAQKATKVGSWETDLSNLKVIWSDETYRIFELNSNTFQASHQAFLNFVHPDDKKIVDDAFVKSFETKTYNSIEHRIITAKDTIKYVVERWKIVFNEQENPTRAIGTCQDITERKQAENALLAKMDELERFHKLTVGRELSMIELKKEINNLLKKLGENPKYKIVE